MILAGAILILALFIILLIIARKRAEPIVHDEEGVDVDSFLDTLTITAPPPVEIAPPVTEPEKEEIMAQFQTAYDIVRRHEGGFQIMPEDSGNYNSLRQLVGTNWGINAQVYEQHIGRPPTEGDMRGMPRHVALSIFKRIYWDRINGDQIRDQQVANIYFDGHVNHGRWGIQMMQRAVGVTADGRPGPITLAAINNANGFKLFNKYKSIRRVGYNDLVRRRPKDQRFLRGWLIRIDSFIYQGGGLIIPSSGPGPTQPPSTSGGGGTIVAVVVAVAAFMFLK